MKRNYIYWASSIVVYAISAWVVGTFYTHDVLAGMLCSIPSIVLGIFIGAAIDGYISSTFPGFLYTPWDDLLRLALERQRKREELQETMLFKMQYMQGIERTIAELNEIFKRNPELRLTRWIVFRAWYKAQIDHMLMRPEIYTLTVSGEPYSKEDDPLYDPDAPDWSIYDRDRNYTYDDDDSDNDNDLDYYGDKHKQRNAGDAFCTGLGVGLVNGLTDGSVFSSGSSGSAN